VRETGQDSVINDTGERASAFLAAIVESSDDAIIGKDLQGTITSWNKGAEQIFGYRSEEILGRSIYTIIPPERVDEEERILAQLRRGERIEHYETVRLRKDGARLDISLTVSPIRDENGTIVGASKIARDITERRRLEKELEEERERLQVTLASIGDGVIVIDLSGRIQFLNPVAETLTGWKQAEARNQPLNLVFRIFDEQTQAPVENPVLRALKEGRIVGLANHTALIARDGTKHWLDDSAAPVRRHDGTIIGAVMVFRDIGARRLTQESLAEQAHLLDQSKDAILVRDLEDRITYWNRGAEALYGWTSEEVLGKIPYELLQSIFPEPLPEIRAKFRHDGFWEGELLQTSKDGRRITVLARWAINRNTAGEPTGVIQSHTDISERKKAEHELAKSAAQLRLVVEGAPNGVVMVDERGTILMVNSQMERLSGYGRAEMIGQPVEILLPERYRSAHPGQRAEFFRSPLTRAMGHGRDLFARRKDGTEFAVEVGLNPAETPEGTVVLAAIVDITERKRAEHALRQSEQRYRMLFNSIDEGFCIVQVLFDADNHPIDYRFLELNPSFEKQTGLVNAKGKTIREMAPGNEEFWYEIYGRIALTGEPARFESHAEQLHRWFDVYAFRFGEAENRQVAILFNDITERKRMDQSLAKAKEELESHARNLEATVTDRTAHLQATIAELERVSYSLSHDMRAPLRTIQSFSQIVLSESEGKLGSMETDLLQKSINAASRLDRLIQDVLMYSRVARESIQLRKLNVEKLLRQIIHERPDFQPPKAEIEIQLPLEAVRAHEAYLTQCITNLLDNAVKFVPPGRQARIRIWSELRGNQVRLWFEDNGIGIPREAQARVFEMFQRVHGERAYPGTGIGLTVVRKAVERMGGSAGVESEPEKGSRFWLQLERGEGEW
jgi:PAS domain S-box-containing protein